MNDYEQFSQFFCSEWKEGEVIFAACSLSFLHFILIFLLLLLQDRCVFAAEGLVEGLNLSYQVRSPLSPVGQKC